MNKEHFIDVLKFIFLSILPITWLHFLIRFVKYDSIAPIILLLLSINFLFFLTLILLKTQHAVYFSTGVFILIIVGCANVFLNFKPLTFFTTMILFNSGLLFVLIIYFDSKLTSERNANELSIKEMNVECNIFQMEYNEEKEKNRGLKAGLERMEKMSRTAFLMGASLDENEAAKHLVNETIKILGVNKSLFSKYNKNDNKFYIFSQLGYKDFSNKLTDNIDDWIRETKLPVLVSNINKEIKIRVRRYSDFSNAISIIAAPVLVSGNVYGVVRSEHNDPGFFTNDDLRVLDYISDLGSIVFENLYYLKRIEILARTDGITGLFVHRYMIEKLRNEIQRYFKYKNNLSMIMIDIDDFKHFNDAYGHQFGDHVLACISKVIKDNIREIDFPARYGGDEFMIILPQTAIKGANALTRRLLKKIQSMDLSLPSKKAKSYEEKKCTASLSVGTFKKSYKNLTKFIDKIDAGLYMAKQKGKNRVEIVK